MSDNPEETSYYLRIISLFIDVGTDTVLKVFQYHIPEQNIAQFLSSNDTRKKVSKLWSNKVITKVQCNFLQAPVPNAEKFDIALLITLLISTDLLPPPEKGWDFQPSTTDLSLSADLLRLRNIRNSIVAHKEKAALYKAKFERLWKELEDILIRVNKNVRPDTSKELKQKIQFYRSRSLDGHDESKYSQKLEELWENYEEVSRLQEKVEDLVKKCNEFSLFFSATPEKYSRYVRLLFEGGRLVLCELLNKGLSEQGLDLRAVLFSKRDELDNTIANNELLRQVFTTDETDSFHVNIDMYTWDIIVLTEVIEATIKTNSLTEINIIKDARRNYADTALMNGEHFSTCCEDLVYSIRALSSTLDKETQQKCEEHIKMYRSRSSDNQTTELDCYLNQLKSHETGIKSLFDLYKETLEKLKEAVKKMKETGVSFMNDHVLELKMITLGSSSEKKCFAEDTLHTVWQAALAKSETQDDFDGVRREVDKILEEIRNIPGVKAAEIKRHCIMLFINCSSCVGLLHVIDYLTGDMFKKKLASLSAEMEHICDEAMTIEGNITLESLNRILANPQSCNDAHNEGLSLPIKCSSPEGMRDVLKMLGSERITNSINVIADSLSSHVEETISLKIIPDLKGLSGVFDESENGTSSSSESLTDDNESKDRYPKENGTAIDDTKEKVENEKPVRSEQQFKEAFKKDLVSLYRKRHTTLPIGLTVDDPNKPLLKMYVPPYPLYDVDIQSSEKVTPLWSFREMFVSRENVCRNTYLTAETGIGKTAFVKWLTLCWCQAHDIDDGTTDHNIKESVEEMKEFEFLFTVCVGELDDDRYQVDDMIYRNVITQLSDENNYSIEFLENLLEEERCLIILDGLDENLSKSANCAIPYQSEMDRSLTLTTCTTWTYERLKLSSLLTHKHIRMGPLQISTSETISRNIISLFLGETESSQAFLTFKNLLLEKNMTQLTSSPVLLTHLLSLWMTEGNMDISQCEIYTQMTIALVRRASLKGAFAQQLSIFETDDSPMVECLEDFKPYHSLFIRFGHLAFDTLFGSPTGRHVIFDETEAKNILSSDSSITPFHVLEAGFITGILCKQSPREYFSKKYSISFIHKSVHEFFAALHISTVLSKHIIERIKAICTSVYSITEFQLVFMLLSGFNEERAREILMQLQQVIVSDMAIQKYRQTVSTGSINEIQKIQDMMISCVEESRNSGRGQLLLPLQDALIEYSCENDSNERYLRKLLKANSNDIRSIRVEDSKPGRPSLLEELEPRMLQKLSLCGVSVLQANPCITEYTTLRYLHLECLIFEHDSSDCDIMFALIHLPLIEALGLERMDMTHTMFNETLQYLNRKSNLTQIVLRSIQYTSHSETYPGLSLDLTHNTKLHLFEIEDIPVINVTMNTESLINCTVGYLPDNTASSIFLGLEKASKLQSIVCSDVSAASDVSALINVLPCFSSIVNIDLSFMDFDERIINFPPEMKHLQTIKMQHIAMSAKALHKLVESIQGYRQAVTMELTKCTIMTKLDFELIKTNIRTSSKFTVLDDINKELFKFQTNK